VWFDKGDLPQLARHFYRQSLEERNHAMMIVQYLMDVGIDVTVPGVDEVRNDFTEAAEVVALPASSSCGGSWPSRSRRSRRCPGCST
jgi:ferritin